METKDLFHYFDSFPPDIKTECIRINTEILLYNLGRWDRNSRKIMKDFPESKFLGELFNSCEGTALICATGPSIDNIDGVSRSSRSIDNIDGMNNDNIKIATERAALYLKNKGIKVNYAVLRDSKPEMADILYDAIKDTETTPLISIYADPSVVEKCKDDGIDYYLFGPINPWSLHANCLMEDYGDKIATTLENGVTGGICIDIACRMGFKKIVTIGMDMGFKTKEEAIEYYKTDDVSVMEANGRWGRHPKSYKESLAGIENFKQIYTDVEFFDASDGLTSFYKKFNMEVI